MGLGGVGNSRPAYQDPSAVLCLKGLRSIEIKAHIPFPEGILQILLFCEKDIAGLIDILKPFFLSFQALGTERQHSFPFQRKDVRTLPHIAKILLWHQFLQQLPVPFVFRNIYENTAFIPAFSLVVPAPGSGSQDHIVFSVFLPYLWIPDMLSHVLRIIFHAQ